MTIQEGPDPWTEVSVTTPTFKMVFWVVVVFTAATFSSTIVLPLVDSDPSEQLAETMDMLRQSYLIGFGTIVGLITGKRT